jgi:hypothetical protein
MTQSRLYPSLTAKDVCSLLIEADIRLSPSEITIERRDERWAAFLPGDRIAWFPLSARGAEQLALERKVLALIARRCTFQVPRVLFDSAGFDVRAIVAGRFDPWGLYVESGKDTALARRLGHAIGGSLIEQHSRITAADVRDWLPEHVAWPEPRRWIMQRLPGVTPDAALVSAVERLLVRYEQASLDTKDRVLVHTDLGFHNVVVDPETKELRGIFDYSGAAWADRHHDFRYLVFLRGGEEVFEAAREVYEAAMNLRLDQTRVWLYNAACAASFLAYRHGVAAEEKWCGRTLSEDLAWVRASLAKAMQFS